MEKIVNKGTTAVVNYTGRLEDGQVFDSSEGKTPFQFVVGANQVIPAFESCILGKPVGYKTTVKISAANAYGVVKEELIIKVNKDQVPPEVQVGQTLHATAQGQEVAVLVKEINEDHIVIDGNHPLAGKNLEFDLEVLDVI